MLLIEVENVPVWGKTYLNANMMQDMHVVDGEIRANIIDSAEYTARIARFENNKQATAALERLIPYLGKSGDGIIKLNQWTRKE